MKSNADMVAKVADYLSHRRSLGYALKAEERQLVDFARYAERMGHRGPLTLELTLRWARLPAGADPTYWARRLGVVRGLAKYLRLQEPNTEVPPNRILGPVCRRKTPHIYSQEEVVQLLRKARRCCRGKGLQPHTISTVIGLLAVTGMRISEVLHLRGNDVDLKNRIITVREAKFHKSRLVPLHATTTAKLARYAKARHRCFPNAQSFFVSRRGAPLAYGTMQHAFHQLVKGIPARGAYPWPRLHDLRHAFACRTLTRWSKRPVIMDQRMLLLMHYLGHTQIRHTYWYLSAIPELLARAAVHFESYANPSAP